MIVNILPRSLRSFLIITGTVCIGITSAISAANAQESLEQAHPSDNQYITQDSTNLQTTESIPDSSAELAASLASGGKDLLALVAASSPDDLASGLKEPPAVVHMPASALIPVSKGGRSKRHGPQPLANVELAVAFSIAPPFVIVNRNFNDLDGIDVDIVRELQKRTGFKLKSNRFDLVNFGQMIDMAKDGNIDISGGAISLTEERGRIFELVGPTVSSSSVVVVRKGSTASTLNDLNGKSIAAEEGTVAEDYIPEDSGIHVTMHGTPTNFMAFYRVAANLSDAMITDGPVAYDYVSNWHGARLKIAFALPDSESQMGLLLKKGTRATEVLVDAYHDMLEDGTVRKILLKYFNTKDAEQIAHFKIMAP